MEPFHYTQLEFGQNMGMISTQAGILISIFLKKCIIFFNVGFEVKSEVNVENPEILFS